MIERFKNSPRRILFVRNFANLFYITQDFFIYILSYLFVSKKNRQKKINIITAADSSHFQTSKQLISSIQKHEKSTNIVFYDLGLSDSQSKEIMNLGLEYQKFKFNDYPSFMKLSEPDAGAYAWKPQIINYELKKSNNLIIWMDAGNILTSDLKKIRYIISKFGFYSPLSNGHVKQWTHETTLYELNVKDSIYKKRMLNAAIIGIDPQNKKTQSLVTKWGNLSLNKDLILPKGAGKENHRWDQSLLTILFYKNYKKVLFPRTHKFFGVITHQDID